MPIYTLDFSDDEYDLCECSLCKVRDYPIFKPKNIIMDIDNVIMEDDETDTEDDMSVDLDDHASEDEQDLKDGEEEYEKFKHTLSDFIVDDMIEDEEEYQPRTKRKRVEE